MHLLVKHNRNLQKCTAHTVSRPCLSFLSTGSAFQLFQNFFNPSVIEQGVPVVLMKNLISTDANHFLSLLLGAQISFPYKRMGTASALYVFILSNIIAIIKFPSSMFLYVLLYFHYWLIYIKSLQFPCYLNSQTSRRVSI